MRRGSARGPSKSTKYETTGPTTLTAIAIAIAIAIATT